LQTLQVDLRKYDVPDELFVMETVLSGWYKGALLKELGKDFFDISQKSKEMLLDIEFLKSLLLTLLESDAIKFHLRYLESKNIESQFSIFYQPHEDTEKLLKRLEAVNLQRIYTIEDKGKDTIRDTKKWPFSKIGKFNEANSKSWETWEMSIKNECLDLNGAEEDFEGFLTKD